MFWRFWLIVWACWILFTLYLWLWDRGGIGMVLVSAGCFALCDWAVRRGMR